MNISSPQRPSLPPDVCIKKENYSLTNDFRSAPAEDMCFVTGSPNFEHVARPPLAPEVQATGFT